MTDPSLRIRIVEAADVAAVREVLVAAWHDTYDELFGRERVTELTDDWYSLANLQREVQRDALVFLLAERDGATVATGSAERRGDTVVLWRLYVHPDAQSQGIGTALLHALLSHFDDHAAVELKVAAANPRAIAFYERHGFIPGDIEREHLRMRRPARPR